MFKNRISSLRFGAGLVLAVCIIACSAPELVAQNGDGLPVIRVRSREVLVPFMVHTTGRNYPVHNLEITDFLLFEDGVKQQIRSLQFELPYLGQSLDNLGFQSTYVLTPMGKWVTFVTTPFWEFQDGLYVLSYMPPESPEGSCHKLKLKLAPVDRQGNAFVMAELPLRDSKDAPPNLLKVSRSNVWIYARDEYCNTEHFANDPVVATKLGKRMESYLSEGKGKGSSLQIQTTTFRVSPYASSGLARVHITVDFPSGAKKGIMANGGVPDVLFAIMGMIYRKDGTLAARFSDSDPSGCLYGPDDEVDKDSRTSSYQICRQDMPNHYETEVQLPAGEYDLRVAMSYGGVFDRLQVPVSVDSYDGKQLGLSDIALCKRYYQHQEPKSASVPTMQLELPPLVSKGIEFTPTGDTQFRKGEPLIAYFELYKPEPDVTQGKISFRLKVIDLKTNELKIDTGMRDAASWVQSGSAVIPVTQEIAIQKLPRGSYRLEVQASDSLGASTVWRAADFRVE
jgi:hypothetical protein